MSFGPLKLYAKCIGYEPTKAHLLDLGNYGSIISLHAKPIFPPPSLVPGSLYKYPCLLSTFLVPGPPSQSQGISQSFVPVKSNLFAPSTMLRIATLWLPIQQEVFAAAAWSAIARPPASYELPLSDTVPREGAGCKSGAYQVHYHYKLHPSSQCGWRKCDQFHRGNPETAQPNWNRA